MENTSYQSTSPTIALSQQRLLPGWVIADDRAIQIRAALRILFALCAAPVVTIGLILIMNALIDGDLGEPEPSQKIIIDTVFDIPEETPPPPPPRAQEPDEVQPQPELERFRSVLTDESVVFDPVAVEVNTATEFDHSLFDSDVPVRLVAVAPQYPQIATERGIEGYVEVRFDVTKAGTTENIEILAFEPSTIFNRAVLKAVSRWRYQPKLVKGEPVATQGVMERIVFNLEKS